MKNNSLLMVLSLMACMSVSCSPEAMKQTMKPYLPNESMEEGGDAQLYDPAVDILFVVDNSYSMYGHQANMARNITLFTSAFSRFSFLEYNFGVTTTDPNNNGKLFGSARVVSKNTPNFEQVLASNIMVGTSGSGSEESFGPTANALSPAMLGGWNKGFYRQNASLVVIFITDAEDQSDIEAKELYDTLVALKGGQANKLLAYGVIIPTWDTSPGCARDGSETPQRIEEFLAMVPNGATGKNVMHLCAQDFGSKLADMAKDIVDQVGRLIYLSRLPDVKSIKVMYGSMVLPSHPKTGWTYDPSRNAIILGDEIDLTGQPVGSQVKIYFNAAQAPN